MSSSEHTLDLRAARDFAREEPAAPAPLVGREQTLRVTYTDPEGRVHEDLVVSRVLDANGRMSFSRVLSGLVARAGGAWERLPTTEQAYLYAFATLAVQLQEPPAWINQWAGQDDRLLMLLFEACQGHASKYFRGDDGAGGEGTPGPRLAVVSAGAPAGQ